MLQCREIGALAHGEICRVLNELHTAMRTYQVCYNFVVISSELYASLTLDGIILMRKQCLMFQGFISSTLIYKIVHIMCFKLYMFQFSVVIISFLIRNKSFYFAAVLP